MMTKLVKLTVINSLDCTFNKFLSWNLHINYLCSKLRSRLYLFNKIKHYLPLGARIRFYEGLVQPIIDYGCVIWGNTTKENLKRIHRLMKMFARSILDIKKAKDSNIVELFMKLGWIPIDERIKYFKCVMIYKAAHGLSPDYISNMFNPIHFIHSHNTRASVRQELYVPNFKSESGRKTFIYSGAQLWNSLSPYILNAVSLPTFKKRYMVILKLLIYNTDHFWIDQ